MQQARKPGGYLSLVKSNRGAAENADSETLTGTAWWDGSQKGKDYILSGAGTLDLYVTFDSTADSNGYGAFSVELLSDGNKYITTNSNYDAWVNGCTGTITGALKEQASTIVVGHVYKISVKRTDNDFSVVYYDLTDDKEYCSMEITGTDHATDVNIHIIAQVGTYIVSQTAPTIKPDEPGTEDPKPDNPGTEDPKPDEPGTEDPKPDNPGTDTPGDTENSVTFEGWWTKHLDGEKVTEDGITLKFKAKSNGSLRYEVPVYAVFSSDDGKVGKAETNGYAEYGVMRSDYNGWGEVKYWGQGATTYNPTAAETEEAVKDWTPTQKEFNDYIVEAYKEGTNVYMKITAGTLITFAKFTVPAEKDVYLALTGENCTVENYTCSATENKFTDANEPADVVLGPDKLDCKGYRMAFSGGNEITSDGVAVTFNSKC